MSRVTHLKESDVVNFYRSTLPCSDQQLAIRSNSLTWICGSRSKKITLSTAMNASSVEVSDQ